jgi:hypothetical protein
MEVSLFTLKLALLLFWAAWFAMVFLTNLLSGLKAAGMLGKEWKFASTNYEAVAKAVAIYDAPPWVPRLLFSGVVVWQFIAATLFGWAILRGPGPLGRLHAGRRDHHQLSIRTHPRVAVHRAAGDAGRALPALTENRGQSPVY